MDITSVFSMLDSGLSMLAAFGVLIWRIERRYSGMDKSIALIQKDVEIINRNHEQHIQDIVQTLKEHSVAIKENREVLLRIAERMHIKES